LAFTTGAGVVVVVLPLVAFVVGLAAGFVVGVDVGFVVVGVVGRCRRCRCVFLIDCGLSVPRSTRCSDAAARADTEPWAYAAVNGLAVDSTTATSDAAKIPALMPLLSTRPVITLLRLDESRIA